MEGPRLCKLKPRLSSWLATRARRQGSQSDTQCCVPSDSVAPSLGTGGESPGTETHWSFKARAGTVSVTNTEKAAWRKGIGVRRLLNAADFLGGAGNFPVYWQNGVLFLNSRDRRISSIMICGKELRLGCVCGGGVSLKAPDKSDQSRGWQARGKPGSRRQARRLLQEPVREAGGLKRGAEGTGVCDLKGVKAARLW